ncbi:hypothetical protein D3C75_563540 [compost metagenome]
MHRFGHLSRSDASFLAAPQHHLVGGADGATGLHHLPDNRVQIIDEAVDPAPHVTGLIVGHSRGVQTLTKVALAFGDGPDHTRHLAQPCRQPFRSQQAEQYRGANHTHDLHGIDQPLFQAAVVLDHEIAGKKPRHSCQIRLHQAIAERASAINLFQIGLTHHAPDIR